MSEEKPTRRLIRPIHDQVLIAQDPPKEKLASGLFLLEGTRDLYEDIGTVIATGPGRTTEGGVLVPCAVKAGDRVLFKRRPDSALFSRKDDEWEGLLMLRDVDIMGVLESE